MALTRKEALAYRKARDALTRHAAVVRECLAKIEASADRCQAAVDEVDDNRFASVEALVVDADLTDDAVTAWLDDSLAELSDWEAIDADPEEG